MTAILLPLLRLAGHGHAHRFRDAVGQLAAHFDLSDSDSFESEEIAKCYGVPDVDLLASAVICAVYG